ncbi:hypothetical protein [Rhizobium sp.]
MNRSWMDIAEFYRDLGRPTEDPALLALERLARRIARSALNDALFGWTSVTELGIQQMPIRPYMGPFLRVTPKPRAMLEFRYEDTSIRGRQWVRLDPAQQVTERFQSFMEQLHWTYDPTALHPVDRVAH